MHSITFYPNSCLGGVEHAEGEDLDDFLAPDDEEEESASGLTLT